MYESIEHTSDLGLRIQASDLNTLFREAAEGLFSLMVEALASQAGIGERTFELAADSLDLLLFDWLNELLYTFDTTRNLLGRFEVRVVGTGLTARALGSRLDPSAHHLLHEVKAITYHGLKVERSGDGWLAEVVVDI